jgi:hypothetical protein
VSTGHGAVSTGHGVVSTRHGAVSTGHGAVSTGHGAVSTGHGAVSTGHGAVSTRHGAVSTGQGSGERLDPCPRPSILWLRAVSTVLYSNYRAFLRKHQLPECPSERVLYLLQLLGMWREPRGMCCQRIFF